jgi:hypothetical protein
MRNAYKILVGKSAKRTPLGRLRCRWEYSMKIDLKETVSDDVNWIHLKMAFFLGCSAV